MRTIVRKAIASAATVGVAIGLAATAVTSASAYQPSPANVYTAQNPAACNKFPCVLYPKTAQLPSGRIVATFEDSESAVVGQKMPVHKSDDHGTTWQKLTDVPAPAYLSTDPQYAKYTSNWTNPYLYVMPETVGNLAAGTLLLANVVSGDDAYYNEQKAANPSWKPTGDGDRRDLAIALFSSTDEGATWNLVNVIATGSWQGGSAGAVGRTSEANTYDQVDPLWEPYLMVHQGKLVAYYSDENDYLSYDPATGIPVLDPANDTAPDSHGQILVHKTWDGSSSAWSSPVVDVAGLTVDRGNGKKQIGGGRPGMETIVPTTDGKWLVTYEYFGGGDNVRYKVGTDPLKFHAASDADGDNITLLPTVGPRLSRGGSPVLIKLPDGRIVYNAAGSGSVWVNESGRSDGQWKQYQTSIAGGYSRNMQYVDGTGRVLILQAAWGGGSIGPVKYAEVDLGHSEGAYYTLVNRKTGQVLSPEADKTQDANLTGNVPDIISWSDNPANDTQRWHITPKGSSVTLLNKAGGRSLAIWTGSATAGQRLAQWVDDGAADKLWNLVPTSDGYVKLQPVRNTALFATGATANGAVDLRAAVDASTDASADDAQEWKLVQQAPTVSALTVRTEATSLISAESVAPGATIELNAAGFDPAGSPTHANTTGHVYAFNASGEMTDLGAVAFNADQKGNVTLPDTMAEGSDLKIAVLFDTTAVIWDSTTVQAAVRPEVTASVTGVQPNEAGWRTGPATVSLSLNDGAKATIEYQIGQGEWQPYTSPVEITQDGQTPVSYRATVNGEPVDNSGGVETVRIDRTPPTVNLIGGPTGSYTFGHDPAAPTCEAADAASGLATCVVTGGGTSVGTHSYTATATDNAGNVSTSELQYSVQPWDLKGFTAPVDMGGVWNTVKGGSTVPFKFELFDGATELTSVADVKSFTAATVSCPGASAVTDEIEFLATGGTSLSYSDGAYTQKWATPKKPGSCIQVTMTTRDNSKLVANFIMK